MCTFQHIYRLISQQFQSFAYLNTAIVKLFSFLNRDTIPCNNYICFEKKFTIIQFRCIIEMLTFYVSQVWNLIECRGNLSVYMYIYVCIYKGSTIFLYLKCTKIYTLIILRYLLFVWNYNMTPRESLLVSFFFKLQSLVFSSNDTLQKIFKKISLPKENLGGRRKQWDISIFGITLDVLLHYALTNKK